MQIKTTMRYRFIPTGMAIIKKAADDKDVEKQEPSYTVDGNVKRCSHCGKQVVPENVMVTI